MKAIVQNTDDKIEVTIRDDEIIVEGIELKPYWKRILLLLWWKNPVLIFKNPRVIFNRESKGELVALFG